MIRLSLSRWVFQSTKFWQSCEHSSLRISLCRLLFNKSTTCCVRSPNTRLEWTSKLYGTQRKHELYRISGGYLFENINLPTLSYENRTEARCFFAIPPIRSILRSKDYNACSWWYSVERCDCFFSTIFFFSKVCNLQAELRPRMGTQACTCALRTPCSLPLTLPVTSDNLEKCKSRVVSKQIRPWSLKIPFRFGG